MKRLKAAVWLLLMLQAALFTHILLTLEKPHITGYVPAIGGAVTQADLSTTPWWAGVYGTLSGNATNTTVKSGDLIRLDTKYDDTDNECKRTEIIFSNKTTVIDDIISLHPAQADTILGFQTTDGQSPSATYTTQYPYGLGARTVYLWSTTIKGTAGEFITGIAQDNNNAILFITQTRQNGFAYDGSSANYQTLLPPGTWQVSYDTSDACTEITTNTTQDNTSRQKRLVIATPGRMCAQEENEIYVANAIGRLSCGIQDIGDFSCEPIKDASVVVSDKGTELISKTTDEEGKAIALLPEGEYTIKATSGTRQSTKKVIVSKCLGSGLSAQGNNVYTGNYPDVNALLISQSLTPRKEEPLSANSKLLSAEYIIIALLTPIIVFISGMIYFNTHKDTAIWLLKLRIWLKEIR